jgi:hypothetical protein
LIVGGPGLTRASIFFAKKFYEAGWIGPRVKPGEVKPGNDDPDPTDPAFRYELMRFFL